ncbi:MAG: alpha/beta hydrolase [Bacteroidia bacterium]
MYSSDGHFDVIGAQPGEMSYLLEIPTEAQALLAIGHGAGAGMRHASLERLAKALHRQRIATLRYQFPFMERGGGRDSEAVSLATVQAAFDLGSRQGLPSFAGGHSFGGRMTSLAAAAGMLPQALGLIFFAFPLHAAGRPGTERAAHLSRIAQPMLFLSGTRDTLAQADLLTGVLASTQATLHWLDTADHGYKTLRTRASQEDIFDEMARIAAAWIHLLRVSGV